MDLGRLLRDARVGAGLTQAELAEFAKTSQSAVAAYETGAKEPSWSVLQRLIEGSGQRLSLSAQPDPRLYRLTDVARDLRLTDDAARRFRIVLEFLRGAHEDAHPLALLVRQEPETTGDARYDALLAAMAEDLCTAAGQSAPAWVAAPSRFLAGFWWVSDLPSARARALVHSPASYRRRGVMLERADLLAA